MNSSPTSRSQARRRRRKPPLKLRLMRRAFRHLGPLWPALFGAWAARIWVSTRRFDPPRREGPWLQSAQQVRLQLAGFPVMTYQWGEPDRPLVVLVHGWNGRGSQMAAFAEPLVEAGFRVLGFDAPGHGQTPGRATNIFEIRDVLKAIAAQVAPLHGIVAHSFGGMVASLALSEGLKARRVVLLSTPANFEMLIRHFCRALQVPAAVQARLQQHLARRFGDGLGERVSTTHTCQTLSRVAALLLHDEDDHDVPLAQAEQIHRHWPGSQLHVTRRLGHKRLLYNPKVIQQVVAFIREN